MSKAQTYERSRTRVAGLLALLVGLCGVLVLVACASSANRPADDISLPADHGYVLIRTTTNMIPANPSEYGFLVFKNYATGKLFSICPFTTYSAGVRAWLSLISVPKGPYYFNRYSTFAPRNERTIEATEVSNEDIFEVKPGVVNYIGDWDVTYRNLSWRREVQLDVTYGMVAVEKSKAYFPEHLEKYEVFMSIRGKKPTSLYDLAEIIRKRSESDDE